MRDTTHWVGTWTAAPAPAEGAAFANHTLRMTPRVSIGGSGSFYAGLAATCVALLFAIFSIVWKPGRPRDGD